MAIIIPSMMVIVSMVMVVPRRLRSTRKIAPSGTSACRNGFSPATESVSPVGSKKNVRKSEPGSQAKFSGRLNGVAPAVSLPQHWHRKEPYHAGLRRVDRDPLDWIVRARRMQFELGGGGDVGVALLRCCAAEYDRRPINRHLQRLKVTAVFDAVGVVGNKAVDERVRLPALVKVYRRGGRELMAPPVSSMM